MRLTVAELREIIREGFAGSDPNEVYDHDLIDDPAFKQKSVYVPDDIKDAIGKWLKAMGLTRKGKRRSRSA